MRIQILELEKHRNETTFRPYLRAIPQFREHGIEFVDNNPDIYWVGQASVIDKKVSLQESINKGCEYLSKLDAPYVLFDGQDSSSLMGVWDVFREVPGYRLAKNVVLKNLNDYVNKYAGGRWFWGESDTGYGVNTSDLDLLSSKLVHSGTNWLNTYGNEMSFGDFNGNKQYDVAVLIGIGPENYEFQQRVDQHYNDPRRHLFDVVGKLKLNVITTQTTGKLDKNAYMTALWNSKVCVSPFGYGEINIREFECMIAGTPIVKPNIDRVKSTPFIYGEECSVDCLPDYSDLEQSIDVLLSDYSSALGRVVNQREIFAHKASNKYIVNHVINNILT